MTKSMTVLKGGKEEEIEIKIQKLCLYFKGFVKACESLTKDPNNRDAVKQAIFYGVRCLPYQVDNSDYEYTVRLYQDFNIIFDLAERLTPKELIQIFPVTKSYDGEKWQIKDYFYTMQALEALGMDQPIGEGNIKELFWDYQNPYISEFLVGFLSIVSALYKRETGKTPFEELLEKENIKTYPVVAEPDGTRYVLDPDTDEKTKVKRRIPRYLKPIDISD